LPLAFIHLIADKGCSRKPLFTLSDAYALGPGLSLRGVPASTLRGGWIEEPKRMHFGIIDVVLAVVAIILLVLVIRQLIY
jgi:hypothetical protein